MSTLSSIAAIAALIGNHHWPERAPERVDNFGEMMRPSHRVFYVPLKLRTQVDRLRPCCSAVVVWNFSQTTARKLIRLVIRMAGCWRT